MFSLAIIKSLQIYGIAIVISMVVAVLIKLLVTLTGRVKKPSTVVVAPQKAPPPIMETVPGEVIAVISAALAACLGPHRILHIAESQSNWSNLGRAAQHSSHQMKH